MPPKASQKARRPSATRSKTPTTSDSPPTLNRAHLQGFTAGCIVGIAVSVGLMRTPSEPQDLVASPTPVVPYTDEAGSPHFDFYTMLPNQALDLNPEIEPADLQARTDSQAQYLLQAGSFRQRTEADRRRGELALLGLEATVEASENDNGRWYRVYLGPFENRSEMARARALTAQADVDTLLLKRAAP